MEFLVIFWLCLAVFIAFDSSSNRIPTSADIGYAEIHSFYWAIAFFLAGLLPLFFYLPIRSKVLQKKRNKKKQRIINLEDTSEQEERLKTLVNLRFKDLITEEEYQARRKNIIDSI
jgi:hypothetical protein